MQTIDVIGADTARDTRLLTWSLDARLMTRPARTCRELATQPLERGRVTALRRPVTIAITLGCLASVASAGIATLRLVAPATIYWAYAPLTQAVALGLVLLTMRRHRQPISAVIDVYFAGRAPMLLLFLATGWMLGTTNPDFAWTLLTTVGVAAAVVIIAWSARIDYCFFRHFLRQSPAGSVARVLALRVIVWPVVFGVFAVPGMTFGAIGEEVAGIVRELVGG